MKVNVDMKLCQHYGQCVFAAPEVFELNDDGLLEYNDTPSDEFREKVLDAIDVCPMQAISIPEM